MLALIRRRFPDNAGIRLVFLDLLYAKGRIDDAQRFADSVGASPEVILGTNAAVWRGRLALLRGRYDEWRRFDREARDGFRMQAIPRIALTDSIDVLYTDAWFHGPSDRLVQAIDATLIALPLSTVADVDRPYFQSATTYALAGRPDKGRAILEQREREIVDTALLRLQQPSVHTTLAEIALAEHKPLIALAEFRRGGVVPIDPHTTECGIVCLSFNLARAFDAAEMPDSAIAMYERYIATPFSRRWRDIDHVALAGAHKRLGELYEAKGERQKASSHYMQFIELWKTADPEFQPRVSEVRRRLARLADRERRN
jgi:tetratricopeptide (TPR) repeat protein